MRKTRCRCVEVEHLNDDRERFDHEEAADNAEDKLVFRGNCDGTEGTAEGQRACVAHEDGCGGRVIPQEPEATAYHSGGEDEDFAGAGDVVHVEILGKVDAAHGIGDDAERGGCDHHRHDGKPIEAIGQIHGIGRADDDDHGKGQEEQAEVQERVLEKRQRKPPIAGLRGCSVVDHQEAINAIRKPRPRRSLPETPDVFCLETLA